MEHISFIPYVGFAEVRTLLRYDGGYLRAPKS